MTAVGPMSYPGVPKKTFFKTPRGGRRRHQLFLVAVSRMFVSEMDVSNLTL